MRRPEMSYAARLRPWPRDGSARMQDMTRHISPNRATTGFAGARCPRHARKYVRRT